MPWRFSRASAPVFATLVAGSALAQPMGSSLPGPGPAQGPAPVPGSSIGTDAPVTRTRELAAEKCDKLPEDRKNACLRDARQHGTEGAPAAGATSERGTVDRVGPGSTGMGSGAPR